MTQRTIKIDPHEFLKDVRDGLDDSGLIGKYGLNQEAVAQIFQKAIDQGLFTREELDARTASLNTRRTRGKSDDAQDHSSCPTEKSNLGEKQSVDDEETIRWWIHLFYPILAAICPWRTEVEHRAEAKVCNHSPKIGIPFLNAWNHDADFKTFRKEKWIFWGGVLFAFLAVAGMGYAYAHFFPDQKKDLIGEIQLRQLIIVYFIYRAMRFLRQPLWFTVTCCCICFLQIIWMIIRLPIGLIPYLVVGISFEVPRLKTWAGRIGRKTDTLLKEASDKGQEMGRIVKEEAKRSGKKTVRRASDWLKAKFGNAIAGGEPTDSK